MIIKKITTGFVIQTFDTNKKAFVSQEFVAGDQCDYEDERGATISPGYLNIDGQEAYLPFDMKQPD